MTVYLIDPVFEDIETEITWDEEFTSIYQNLARASGGNVLERPVDGRNPDIALASLLRARSLPREGLLFDCRVGEVMSWPSPSFRVMHHADLCTYQPFVISHLGGVEFAHALTLAEAMAEAGRLPPSICTLVHIDAADLGRKVPLSSGIGCVLLSAEEPSAAEIVWRLDACDLGGGNGEATGMASTADAGLKRLAASTISGRRKLSMEINGAHSMRAHVVVSRVR